MGKWWISSLALALAACETLAVPANNSCTNAIAVSEGTFSIDTRDATTDGPTEGACAFDGDNQIGRDIWYCYTASASGQVSVSLCGSSFDSKMAVYRGCTCPTAANSSITCDDDGCGSAGGPSELTFSATAGQSYLIRIGGFTDPRIGVARTGVGKMTITNTAGGGGTGGPPNNSCSKPIAVSDGSFTFDTRGATTDGPNESACALDGDHQIGKDVWYCYTASRTGTVTFSLCSSNYDSKMAVYKGCGCPTTDNMASVCDDDGCGTTGGASQVKLTVLAGKSYMVRIGGFTNPSTHVTATGTGTLKISFDGLPDLVFNGAAANPKIITKTFSTSDCAVNECATPGTRKLINFTGELWNIGQADLVLGNPAANTLYKFDPCHGHYHIQGFADYRLIDSGGQVAAGLKFGFCIREDRRISASAPPNPVYNCSNQGLQRGWADVYGANLPCQWIDITGVPRGSYTLQMTTNPDHFLPESNFGNNTTNVPVQIPADTGSAASITLWTSVHTHSGLGPLAIGLAPTRTGNGGTGPVVESRVGGIRIIQVTFNKSVTLANPAGVTVTGYLTDASGTRSGISTFSHSTVSMAAPNVLQILFNAGQLPDRGCYTITLNPAIIAEGISGDNNCMIRSLVGDVTQNGSVQASDVTYVQSKTGASVAREPWIDVDLSGAIGSGDASVVQSRVGAIVLCP